MAHEKFDVLVVGAGFAGLYLLHKLRSMGFAVRVLEAAGDIGGTWHWNRYPGARCDVESMEYSYQFSQELQQEWEWSERYATQPEILRYIHHVAERFDLRKDIQLNTRVTAASFDETTCRWNLTTDTEEHLEGKFCVMATGCLSSTNRPKLPGLENFEGAIYHTGTWPHEKVDFSGKRVGIIGTGSSAIQAIPLIAQEAAHLFVFQRTANYSVPAQNGSIDPVHVKKIKANYAQFRAKNNRNPAALSIPAGGHSALEVSAEERQATFETRWQQGGFSFMRAFGDLLLKQEANDMAAEFVRQKIRQTVKDPEVARRLSPQQVIGCKRLCLDSGYFETFNRANVTLVDIGEFPIETLLPKGLRHEKGEFEFDCLVLATGFDAMTGTLNKMQIRGRAGELLKEKWSAGPLTYLGLGMAGFPNLFLVSGPGSPSVLTNMLPSIEQHVNWIADCLDYLRRHRHQCIEAQAEAESAWVAHVNEVAHRTLYPHCNSWYLGANVPGKPRVFMPYLGFPAYVDKCDEVSSKGYEGFVLT